MERPYRKNHVNTSSKKLLFLTGKFTFTIILTNELVFNCLLFSMEKNLDNVTEGISSAYFQKGSYLVKILRSSQP